MDRVNRGDNDPYFSSVVDLLKVRSKKVTELIDNSVYFFQDPVSYEEEAVKKQFKPETVGLLKALLIELEKISPFDTSLLEKIYQEYSEKSNIQPGQIIHPTRLAISGVSFGPGLFELMSVLGKEIVVRRIKNAISYIEKNESIEENYGYRKHKIRS